jgi:glycosyltransferase 2 family protein
MKIKYLKIIIRIIFPLSFLLYFLLNSNLGIVFSNLKRFSVWLFIGGTLLTILSILVNSFKWNLLLKGQKIGVLFKLNMISQFYTLILPGQIAGEAIKTYILGKKNNNLEGVAVSVAVDKITGFMGLFIIMIGGLLATKILYSSIMLWSVIGAFIAGIFFIFCLQINIIFKSVDKFLYHIESNFPKLKKIVESLRKAFEAWNIYSKYELRILLSIFGGILYQFMGVLLIFLFANNLHIYIPLVDWFWIVGLLSIALFLPITIGGIGVREGTIVGILGSLGVTQESALALSFAIFGIQIVTSLIGGVISLTMPLKNN